MSADRDDIRDEGVARIWREHVRDEPPPAIDEAIRAAARRAVDAKPQVARKAAEARGPWRWWMPLAAAATIGAVAVGVIQNMPQDAGEPTVVSDMTNARRAAPEAAPPTQAPAPMQEAVPQKKVAPPASAPEVRDRTPLPMPRLQASKPDATPKRADAPSESKETFVAPPPPVDARQVDAGADKLKQEQQVGALQKRAQATEDVLRRNERDAPSGFVASPPPASAPPASAPPPSLAGSAAPARKAKDALDAVEPESRAKLRSAVAPSAPAAQSAQAAGGRSVNEPQAMAVTPPDAFVATIRRLLAAGDRDGAVRELQRFRRAHVDADARLPDDLKAFAASVPR